MNVDFPHCAAAAASPFAEGERNEVRRFCYHPTRANPHPILSLEKGEGRRRRDAFLADVLVRTVGSKAFALAVLIGVGFCLLVIPAFTGALGANPADELLHQTGKIAIWTIGAVLSLSALSVLFTLSHLVNAINRHQRAIWCN